MDTPPVYKLYWKAMKATTVPEAEAILEELIELALKEKPELSYAEARAIQLSNIGYFTGYLEDRIQQVRVLSLFKTEHPIFGSYQAEVTPEKAFEAGMALGALIKDGNLTEHAIRSVRQIIQGRDAAKHSLAREDGQPPKSLKR
jgi:hypothetical protein